MAGATPWGQEFTITTTAGGSLWRPHEDITALANGRFVAAWADDTATLGIKVQLFNADGSRAGDTYVEPVTDGRPQINPVITPLPDGGFVMAWEEWSQTTGNYDRAQVFDANGVASGGQLTLSMPGWLGGLDFTALAGGGFAAIWHNYTGLITGAVQVFNSAGHTVGPTTALNATGNNYLINPTVEGLADGRFVAAWEDTAYPGRVIARLFNADGTSASADFRLGTSTAVQRDPHIAALADGGFAAVWVDFRNGPFEIFGAMFGANGTTTVNEFKVSGSATAHDFDPAIAQLADGRLVVAWAGANEDSIQLNPDIYVQVFNLDGSKSGGEMLVHPTSPVEQWDPTIAVLADGRFVVSWEDATFVPDPVNYYGYYLYDQHAQIFDPRGGPVDLAGMARDDDLIGTSFNDTMRESTGNDRLDGGPGVDIAMFAQNRDKYLVQQIGDKIAVSGPAGVTTLSHFEYLQFADGVVPANTVPQSPGSPSGPSGPSAPSAPGSHVTGLFDTAYYLGHNADVAAAGVSAIDHFNAFGLSEGRNPNAFFDIKGYVAANDIPAGMSAIDHYHEIGWKQGRDPSANFDTKLYLLHNPDVAAANADPLEHYLQFGMNEGRAIYQAIGEKIVNGFDAEYYVLHNPDVAASGVDPLAHFNQFGWHEGRNPNALFDAAGYLSHYADIAASGVNPLEHYMTFGWKEGRDPSAAFDTLGYLAANPDVAGAGLNPLDHFLTFGIYEGRQAVNDGVWH